MQKRALSSTTPRSEVAHLRRSFVKLLLRPTTARCVAKGGIWRDSPCVGRMQASYSVCGRRASARRMETEHKGRAEQQSAVPSGQGMETQGAQAGPLENAPTRAAARSAAPAAANPLFPPAWLTRLGNRARPTGEAPICARRRPQPDSAAPILSAEGRALLRPQAQVPVQNFESPPPANNSPPRLLRILS